MDNSKFKDLWKMTEDERILEIGGTAMKALGMITFAIDDEPGKMERYIQKLLMNFPQLEVVGDPTPGPAPRFISVRIRRKLLFTGDRSVKVFRV